MLTLERYQIEQDSDTIVIILDQRKNAIINVASSLVMISIAVYLILTQQQSGAFEYAFLGIGILWFLAGIYAFKLKRSYKLKGQRIEYHASNRSGPKIQLSNNLSHIELHEITRVLNKKSKKDPFPWEVRLIGKQKNKLIHTFKFQKEQNAKSLASLISNFYKIEIERSKSEG